MKCISRCVFGFLLVMTLPFATYAQFVEPESRWMSTANYPDGVRVAIPTGLAVADTGDTIVSMGKFPCRLYAIEGKTGKTLFTRNSKGFTFGVDVSADGGKIVLMDYTGPEGASEVGEAQMLCLDRDGKVRWSRSAYGKIRISPSGKYVLTFARSDAILYRGSDGRKLWQTTLGQRALVMSAAFTRDDKYVLVDTGNAAYMIAVDGKKVWTARRQEVHSISTSGNGATTAFLPGFNDDGRLTIVRRSMQAIEMTEARLGVPFAEGGFWDSVGVSDDGSVIVMAGSSAKAWEPQFPTGYIRLAGLNFDGERLWMTPVGTPERGVGNLHVQAFPSGLITVTASTSRSDLFYFLGKDGKLREAWRIPFPLKEQHVASQELHAFSPGGNFLTVLTDENLRLFSLPIAYTDLDGGQIPHP